VISAGTTLVASTHRHEKPPNSTRAYATTTETR
jgi:hypothetical protein